MTGAPAGFLAAPPPSDEVRRIFDADVEEVGHVMNASRVWAHQPATQTALFDLMGAAVAPLGLGRRGRGVLVAACASALGDSYCSLTWGGRLAGDAGADTAAAVLRGDDTGLTAPERAMARWARAVARDPNATTADDVAALRGAGFTDAQVFAITAFVALRLAFATVNDALGARPDAELTGRLPRAVLDAVDYGRPVATA